MSNIIKNENINGVEKLESIKERVNSIHILYQNIMKQGVHYGIIPGTKQPTLLKSGAELLAAYFNLQHKVNIDTEERTGESYYVRVKVSIYKNDILLGEAFGEASTEEEKYKWRYALCEEEYESYPEDKRRIVFKRGRNGINKHKQIRVPVADVANTVLKMAVKRAYVAAIRSVCGASEVWTEDLEDMSPELVEHLASQDKPMISPPKPIQQTEQNSNGSVSESDFVSQPYTDNNDRKITEKQRKRLFAISKNVGMPEEELKLAVKHFAGVEHSSAIPMSVYDDICTFVENYQANKEAGVIERWKEKYSNHTQETEQNTKQE